MKIDAFLNENQDKDIYIYGAGYWGRIVLEYLNDKNYHVGGFIVSDGHKVQTQIEDLNIYELSSWIEWKKQGVIVVAASKENQEEIHDNLLKIDCIPIYYLCKNDIEIENIGILDTSVCNNNIGNNIIMQTVSDYVNSFFYDRYIYRFSWLDDFGDNALEFMHTCKYLFLGGTNALNSHMKEEKSIGITDYNSLYLKNKIVLFGVGWFDYEDDPDEYTRNILNDVLCKTVIHSVRDSYTEKKLKGIGIKNVINTGCPSLWKLTKEHCRIIPKEKSKDVLFMCCCKDLKNDIKIINCIKKYYEKVYCWIQTPTDYTYIKFLCPEVIMISPHLNTLDQFLDDNYGKIDYVGTRLHGGIRCLQHGIRSIIVSIDERAAEMGRDFNLPVVMDYGNITMLEKKINSTWETNIQIPFDNITKWMRQFDELEKEKYFDI